MTLEEIYKDATDIVKCNTISREDKYRFVFSYLDQALIKMGVRMDYYDPDLDYEDDVMAWYNALSETKCTHSLIDTLSTKYKDHM